MGAHLGLLTGCFFCCVVSVLGAVFWLLLVFLVCVERTRSEIVVGSSRGSVWSPNKPKGKGGGGVLFSSLLLVDVAVFSESWRFFPSPFFLAGMMM